MTRTSRIAACVTLLMLIGAVGTAAAAMKGTKQQPVAIIHTSMGDLTCVLFPKSAPIGTANFIGLARGTKDWTDPVSGKKMHGVPLYDNTTFHRVIPNFMIQGGDPAGNGTGTPGYDFKNETWPDLRFDQPGRMAYANAGPDTNGSQFFITEVPTAYLNGGYTIFGQCDAESVKLVRKIARVPRDSSDRPLTPVVIQHIEIDDGSSSQSKKR
jgi:peptidyl-prolyl cis-trans isomerase A (cyclophilin A)